MAQNIELLSLALNQIGILNADWDAKRLNERQVISSFEELRSCLKAEQEAVASIVKSQLDRMQIACEDWDNNHHTSAANQCREQLASERELAVNMLALLEQHGQNELANQLRTAVAHCQV